MRDEPNSGIVNLAWARIEARQGSPREAVDYYHRAIYGTWPKGSEGAPAKVRFELVDFLGKIGSKKQAVTELMALAEEVRNDLSSRKRIGHMLLGFGAALEAAEVFQEVLRQENRDAEAYAGLGDAEFAQHNYRTAQEAYHSALRWDPANTAAQKRQQVCDQIEAMDPTLRGLTSAERFRRSRSLLENTQQAFESCHAGKPDVSLPEEIQTLLEAASKAMRRRIRPSRYAEETETNLEMATEFWQARVNLCGSPPPEDNALTRVLARLGP